MVSDMAGADTGKLFFSKMGVEANRKEISKYLIVNERKRERERERKSEGEKERGGDLGIGN